MINLKKSKLIMDYEQLKTTYHCLHRDIIESEKELNTLRLEVSGFAKQRNGSILEIKKVNFMIQLLQDIKLCFLRLVFAKCC